VPGGTFFLDEPIHHLEQIIPRHGQGMAKLLFLGRIEVGAFASDEIAGAVPDHLLSERAPAQSLYQKSFPASAFPNRVTGDDERDKGK